MVIGILSKDGFLKGKTDDDSDKSLLRKARLVAKMFSIRSNS